MDRPAPKPPTPVAPPAPEPPTLEDELRVLGAKPVTQLRAREEKPRTALEAMRARSQQTPKGKKQGGPTHRPNPDKEVSNTEPASAKDDSQSTADAESDAPTRKTAAEASPGKKTKKPVKARPQVRPEPEPEPEEPPKPKSFWARVRSLITGR